MILVSVCISTLLSYEHRSMCFFVVYLFDIAKCINLSLLVPAITLIAGWEECLLRGQVHPASAAEA